MDDTKQPASPTTSSQTTPIVASGGMPQTNAQQQRVQPEKTPIQQPAHPVSLPQKEFAPISEIVVASSPSETAPVLEHEVTEAGVAHTADHEKVELGLEHVKAGIEHAKESVPVVPSLTSVTNAPFSAQQAVQVIHSTPPDDSKHWLAVLLLAVLHKLHLRQIQESSAVKKEMLQNAA